MNCPPADHSAFKLSVHVVDVGVARMHDGIILLPPKNVEVATVPDTQSRQHMVQKKAVTTHGRSSWKSIPKVRGVFKKSCLRCVYLSL